MQYDQMLPLLAEVAIAITGFAGVVAVFGNNRSRDWSAVDFTRLVSLLTSSLSAFILCLIAIALLAAAISEEITWRIASGLVTVERVLWILRFARVRVSLAASGQTLAFFYFFTFGNVIIALLSLANAFSLGLLWPFITCIVWYLIESSFVFVRSIIQGVR